MFIYHGDRAIVHTSPRGLVNLSTNKSTQPPSRSKKNLPHTYTRVLRAIAPTHAHTFLEGDSCERFSPLFPCIPLHPPPPRARAPTHRAPALVCPPPLVYSLAGEPNGTQQPVHIQRTGSSPRGQAQVQRLRSSGRRAGGPYVLAFRAEDLSQGSGSNVSRQTSPACLIFCFFG